ncbi:MAG TPA: hypothetical protein VLY63_21345 [Anaerolineae bacterium]|nr:hypothetical protein [Anaerolineae bacterium]
MDRILQSDAIAKLPVSELNAALETFLEPVLIHLPEKRLQEVGKLIVQGILGSQSPLITQMARAVAREGKTIWPTAKRLYRFAWNPRFSHRDLLKGLYGIAQCKVTQHAPSHLVAALDPVNFEKPYTKKLEGVSTVMKSTPPGPKKEKRLTSGYPAMTATIVNLPEPVVTYASWFSYVTADFVSENREIYRSIRITRALFPEHQLRFVADAGLDDQKIFHQIDRVEAEFIIRATHNRLVEVFNDRLDRWEEELLDDLTSTVPLPLRLRVKFTHARKVRVADIALGWLKIRIPATQQVLWALVAHDPDYDRQLVLLTNLPIHTAADAKVAYSEWRHRPQIEHTYRFDQEDGLDVEDMRVQTLERMRRIFVMVLLAALFVYHIAHAWPQHMVLWLRHLGGKLGLSQDLDGPYVLLAGIGAVFLTATTLAFAASHPFPRAKGTYG